MRKIILTLSAAFAIASTAFADKKNDPVLLTIDKHPVTVSEFDYLYQKNNAQQTSVQTVDEYLPMFINYKLKVADAEDAGIDRTEAFNNEFQGYVRELSEPYLTDNDALEAIYHDIYNRYNEDVEVSHIMLDAGFGKANRAKQRALLDSLRTAIIDGQADFGDIADQYSIDPAAQHNHGHMGYIAVGRFPYTFEDAAYETPVGQISPVIETPFGIHIVKVDNRRPSRGEVKARHILILNRTRTPEEDASCKQRIDSIYNLLQEGADFADLARRMSEDPGSAQRGGDLDWFGTGMMVPQFEAVAFALDNNEMSEPFKTDYGYHIIQTLDHRGVPAYETVRDNIARMVARDERRNIPMQSRIRSLSEQYNVATDDQLIAATISAIESTGGLSAETLTAYRTDSRPVVNIDNGKSTVTLGELFSTLPDQPASLTAEMIIDAINQRLDAVRNDAILEYERQNLVNSNPDYRNLLNEYRDGMLLFEISDRNVWTKAKEDRDGLENFFNSHRDRYTNWTAPKFKGFIIFATNDSTLRLAKDYLDTHELTRQEVGDSLRSQFGNQIKVERVLAAKGDNPIIDGIAFGGNRPEPTSRWAYYFAYDQKVVDQPEEAADVRGAVTADYQAQLEEQWLADMNRRHKVKVNKKVLNAYKKQLGQQ